MKILAIDFSSELRSIAILSGDHSSSRLCGSREDRGGRNVPAFAMVENVLQQANMGRDEIDAIAIGLGPGSYTGIRAAIALAQGWQLARNIKLFGISSVKCLATQAQASGWRGQVNVIVDAQRQEFYLGIFNLTERGIAEVEPLRIVSSETINDYIAAKQPVLGPEATRYFPAATDLSPTAATLGQMALEMTSTEFVSGESLEPIYLRETNFVKAPQARVI